MAKKNKKSAIPLEEYTKTTNIVPENLGDYNSDGMYKYGTNVILARAIPDITDGLKPVERRTLYATAMIAKSIKSFTKVLSLVGDIVKIHPHGDSSIEDCITGLAKFWELSYPLTEIKGNGGQISGEEAAASRYINGRISKYGADCFFSEWDENLMEMVPSYNRNYKEPAVLLPKYPNMLLKPSTGFTFGMATYIPSYNLVEAFNEVIKYINDHTYEPFLIPDIPSGCQVVDEGKFKEICSTGRGTFKMRSHIEIDNDNHQLIITSLPFKVKLQKVIAAIAKFKKAGAIPGLQQLHDVSNHSSVRLILTFAKEIDLHQVKMFLYEKTGLQDTFTTQMQFVDNYQVRLFNLKEIIAHWVESRRSFKRKMYINRLVKLKEVVYITNVLIDIIESDKAEKIIKMIKKSEDEQLEKMLIKDYSITTVQARRIMNLKVSEFSKSALKRFKELVKTANAEIKDIEKYTSNPKKIDKIIIKELEEGIEKYGTPRKSQVIKIKNESKYSDTEHSLIFTKNGYVKKLLSNSKSVGEFNPGDEPMEVFRANNLDTIILFDRKGYVHSVAVGEIPASDLKHPGVPLTRFVNAGGDIVAIFNKDNIKDSDTFTFITKKGIVKKTSCSKYSFGSSVTSIILKEDDTLVSVLCGADDIDIIAYTDKGMGLRFHTNEFSETNRMSSGVIGIDVGPDDSVVGITTVSKTDDQIVLVTDKGFGKRCMLDTFVADSRRGKVLKLIGLASNEHLISVNACNIYNTIRARLKNGIETISVDQFPELTRNHPGKKLVKVPRGESIINVRKL